MDLDIPYFVYGTLRPGGGNTWAWERFEARAVHDGEVMCGRYALVGRGIPFAVDRGLARMVYSSSEVYGPDAAVGALIYPDDDLLNKQMLRHSMDQLEGHPTGYTRTLTRVYDEEDGQWVMAWIYAWNHTNWVENPDQFHLIESGDYMEEGMPRIHEMT